MKIVISCILVVGLVFNWGKGVGAAAVTTVQSLEVQLDIAGDIYEGLEERIEFTIGRVGEKLLLGQSLTVLERGKDALLRSFINVFNKVLVGFRMDAINVKLGEHTKIFIELTPQAPLIKEIDLKVQFSEVSPEFVAGTAFIEKRVETELNQIFSGLPVAALSWADNIVRTVTNYIIEREYPGFELQQLNKTVVTDDSNLVEFNLLLATKGKLVETVVVDYNSVTIPTWFTSYSLKEDESRCDLLIGVPVEFLHHYQRELETYLLNLFQGVSQLKTVDITTSLKLKPAQCTEVKFNVNSLRLRSNVESRLFLGDSNFSHTLAYFGYEVNDYELYGKWLWGDSPSGGARVGLKFPLSSFFDGGFEYELENNFKSIYFHYQFERGDYFFLRFGLDGSTNEARIGIRLNPHLNLELIDADTEYGIQFMFHLL